MRIIKLTITFITISLFFMACNSSQPDDISYSTPNPNSVPQNENVSTNEDYYLRDNLDLSAVGRLLEKSNNGQEFEYQLNSNNNVNNLDLNGDGYSDYISVSEYENRNDNQRGFTLFDRFGPNDIQEIARIIFDRDRNDDRGARVLLYGNEQIYGDNYYYETNWLDKSLAIANWAFGNRDTYYQSPYYYDNYPDNYESYRVVETPVYRTRIQEYYPEVIFVKTVSPTMIQIKIKSSYKDKSSDKIFGKLAKPTKGQDDFRKNNPNKPEFVPVKPRTAKDNSSKPENNSKNIDKPVQNKNEKTVERSQPKNVENKNKNETKPKNVENRNKNMTKPNNGNKKGGGKPGEN